MDEDVTVKVLEKHILKFFKLSPNYLIEGVDKEKFAYWLAGKLMEEGWIKVSAENVRETLHPLAMNPRYLGGKSEQGKTEGVLPKGSRVVILDKGDLKN